MRNVLAVVPKGNAEMVAAAIRTVFAQPDADHAREQFAVIAAMLRQAAAQGRADAPRRERTTSSPSPTFR